MATLSDLATTVQDMIQRSDQTANIKTEIGNAVRHYSRMCSWVIEHRGGTIALVSGTSWYDTIDLTAGNSVAASPSGTTPSATTSLLNLLGINYAKLELGTIDWPISLISYRQFETLQESNTVNGTPRYIAWYAGQVGAWPVPDSSYTLYLSGLFKPTVPSADSDESVWFTHYQELIENSAARRVAQKWLQDTELAREFRQAEGEQEMLLLSEGQKRTTMGRTTPTQF